MSSFIVIVVFFSAFSVRKRCGAIYLLSTLSMKGVFESASYHVCPECGHAEVFSKRIFTEERFCNISRQRFFPLLILESFDCGCIYEFC